MIIHVVKKSVERFYQTVDFGPALPAGVRVAKAEGAPGVEVIEDGRAVRFVVEKGEGGALTLVLTLSDGQVVAQDVVVKVDDTIPPAPVSVPVAKSPARTYSGNFAQPTNAAHADNAAARAYGSGPDDKRVWRAATAGLPVATCPECDASAQGVRTEVAVKDLALSRNALSRGKMSRMANALRDGVREGDDATPIRVAELHDGSAEGPRYAVLPGEGNHRVAHLMLSRKAGTVPVVVVPRKTAKGDVEGHEFHGNQYGGGGGGSLPGQDKEGFAHYAGAALAGGGGKFSQIAPGSGSGRTFGGKPIASPAKTPSADEQRAAFRAKIGEAARAEFGTDKPSREQVQARAQDQTAKYGKDAKVWAWDSATGSAMPGVVQRDAKSEAYDKSGQREDRAYHVDVADIDKGGSRTITVAHGDVAPRGGVKKSAPVDMADRRSRVRARVTKNRRAKRLTQSLNVR